MLQTRVTVAVLHPAHKFVQASTDRGAKFRDEADIARVTAEMTTELKRRYGEKAIIKIDTRET